MRLQALKPSTVEGLPRKEENAVQGCALPRTDARDRRTHHPGHQVRAGCHPGHMQRRCIALCRSASSLEGPMLGVCPETSASPTPSLASIEQYTFLFLASERVCGVRSHLIRLQLSGLFRTQPVTSVADHCRWSRQPAEISLRSKSRSLRPQSLSA